MATRFQPLPPPSPGEVTRVLAGTARRITRLLETRTEGDEDALARDEPLLATLAAASLRTRIATGPNAGERWRRLGDRVEPQDADCDLEASPRVPQHGGMTLHADVAVPARDRRRLERLCRYVARPPLAVERLEERPDGRLALRLKTRWRDGTTHMLMERHELLERLVPSSRRPGRTRCATTACWRPVPAPAIASCPDPGGHAHWPARRTKHRATRRPGVRPVGCRGHRRRNASPRAPHGARPSRPGTATSLPVSTRHRARAWIGRRRLTRDRTPRPAPAPLGRTPPACLRIGRAPLPPVWCRHASGGGHRTARGGPQDPRVSRSALPSAVARTAGGRPGVAGQRVLGPEPHLDVRSDAGVRSDGARW